MIERVVEQLKEGCINEFQGPGCSMNWPNVDRAKTDRLMRKAAYIIARSLLGGVAETERLPEGYWAAPDEPDSKFLAGIVGVGLNADDFLLKYRAMRDAYKGQVEAGTYMVASPQRTNGGKDE